MLSEKCCDCDYRLCYHPLPMASPPTKPMRRWHYWYITFLIADHWEWFNRVFWIIEPDEPEEVTSMEPYQWR
jgi:hypothetical protein